MAFGAAGIDTAAGAQEGGVGVNEFRRDQPVRQQCLFAVQVGQHAFKQLGALCEAGFEGLELGCRQDQGDRVAAPVGIGFTGQKGGDAFLGEGLVQQVATLGQGFMTKGENGAQQGAPVRPGVPGAVGHFVKRTVVHHVAVPALDWCPV